MSEGGEFDTRKSSTNIHINGVASTRMYIWNLCIVEKSALDLANEMDFEIETLFSTA